MKAKKLPTETQSYSLKNHPFVVPVVTFLCLFVVSLFAFVFMGGSTIQPSDSHVVHLFVDGKEQILPSRATTVADLLKKSDITLAEHDVVEPSLDAEITDDNFNVNVYRAHPVTIVDSDNTTGKKTSFTTYTAQQAPTAIAKQAGIELLPEDKVTVARSDNLLQEGIINQKIVVDRADPVNINLYGSPIPVRTQAQTVAEVLAEKNIVPQSTDTVTPALDTPVTPNMQIFIVVVGKQIITQEEEIPAPTQTISDPNTPVGQTVVQQPGAPGKKLTTYEIQLENGKEAGRKLIQEVIATQPVTKVVAKGTKVVNSRIAGDKSAILAAAGVPASQHFAADFVIARESGWNLAARNAGGCLGLGQACPGSKLVNACPNWQSDATCQIQFFTGYANSRYGSWQGAYEAWLVKHWW